MTQEHLIEACAAHMNHLCKTISDRSVGSEGNRMATRYFRDETAKYGWRTESQEFEATDWIDGGATLIAGDEHYEVLVSPYSPGGSCIAKLRCISTVEALEDAVARNLVRGNIVLLHGSIAAEQLMPKNFVFYNPEEHRKIVALLEEGRPEAIVCATGRNASLAGGVYPFPMIEDGDFDIPSVYMTEEEGARFATKHGSIVTFDSKSQRITADGYNVVASLGGNGNPESAGRIVITAHIDAKKGTPGAIDNATGVAVLLLIAEMLQEWKSRTVVELVAFNGEDYYSVPGQMSYIAANDGRFDEIIYNVNIDGAGYKEGQSAYSLYEMPAELETQARETVAGHEHITEGLQWPQGDHSIFVQFGRPAIAFSSKWFTDHIDNQDITHTPKDNLDIVDNARVVEIARCIVDLVRNTTD